MHTTRACGSAATRHLPNEKLVDIVWTSAGDRKKYTEILNKSVLVV